MTERMFWLRPAAVMQARVNMPTPIYPADTITFDGVTAGSFSNIRPGMTVLFGSNPWQDNYGRQRVRAAATSSSLPIGRSSRGNPDGQVEIVDNAYITVIDDRRIWTKNPFINSDQVTFKDSTISATNGSSIGNARYAPPVANTGPGFAATIDPGTSRITARFDGSKSIAFDDGTGWLTNVASYTWNVADGTITVGSASSAAITATFPAGFRWVSLTVTNTEGKSHTAWCPVFARHPMTDDSTTEFEIPTWVITPFGQEIEMRLASEMPRAIYPDGSLVMIWEGEPASPSDRSHMKFIGWHHDDNERVAGQRTGVVRDGSVRLLDAAGKLKTLPGFPQLIESFAVADKWEKMRKPNMLKYLHYLLYWHSTAMEVVDWIYPEVVLHAFPFVTLGSDANNLYDQSNSICNSVTPDHWLTCTRLGQLEMVIDPMIQDVGSRTSVEQGTITDDDWIDIRFDYIRPPRVHWLRGAAVRGIESEAIIPSSVPVTYTLIPDGQANIGATTVYFIDLPVDIPSGSTITWNLGAHSTTTTANALKGSNSLQVVALTEIIDSWARPQYSTMIDGPPNIPTYFCIAPGEAPGIGVAAIEATPRIASSQASLNNAEGNRYARNNSPLGLVTIVLPWQRVKSWIEPAHMQWVNFDFGNYPPMRGWPFGTSGSPNSRGLVHSIEISREYSRTGMVETATITWETETSGPPAVMVED